MAIKNTLLGNEASAITDELETDSAIVNMIFCNLSNTVEEIDVYLVKFGEEPGDINKILNHVPVNGMNTFSFGSDKIVLSAGDRIYAATTTAANVSATISFVVM